MMSYVLMKTDDPDGRKRKYVAEPGSRWAYCGSIAQARKFKTREEAEAEECGNEMVLEAR